MLSFNSFDGFETNPEDTMSNRFFSLNIIYIHKLTEKVISVYILEEINELEGSYKFDSFQLPMELIVNTLIKK